MAATATVFFQRKHHYSMTILIFVLSIFHATAAWDYDSGWLNARPTDFLRSTVAPGLVPIDYVSFGVNTVVNDNLSSLESVECDEHKDYSSTVDSTIPFDAEAVLASKDAVTMTDAVAEKVVTSTVESEPETTTNFRLRKSRSDGTVKRSAEANNTVVNKVLNIIQAHPHASKTDNEPQPKSRSPAAVAESQVSSTTQSKEEEEFGRLIVQSAMHGLQPRVFWTLMEPAMMTAAFTSTDKTDGAGSVEESHNWRLGFADPLINTDFISELRQRHDEERIGRSQPTKRSADIATTSDNTVDEDGSTEMFVVNAKNPEDENVNTTAAEVVEITTAVLVSRSIKSESESESVTTIATTVTAEADNELEPEAQNQQAFNDMSEAHKAEEHEPPTVEKKEDAENQDNNDVMKSVSDEAVNDEEKAIVKKDASEITAEMTTVSDALREIQNQKALNSIEAETETTTEMTTAIETTAKLTTIEMTTETETMSSEHTKISSAENEVETTTIEATADDDNGNENDGTRASRTIQTEATLDPNRPADPSLEAITLAHPDYRTASTVATTLTSTLRPTGGELGDQRSSSTIMQMGGMSDELNDDRMVIVPTGANTISVESSTVITTVINDRDGSSVSVVESVETTTFPTLRDDSEESERRGNDDNDGIGTVIVDDKSVDFLAALRQINDGGGDASRVKFQNLTVVLPNFNPPVGALFDALAARQPPPQYPSVLPQYQPTIPQQYPRQQPAGLQYPGQRFFQPSFGQRMYDPRLSYANTEAGGFVTPSRDVWRKVEPKISGVRSRYRREDALIDADSLNALMKSQRNLRVLDTSYEPDSSSALSQDFSNFTYAKWDKLMADKKGAQFQQSHIPGAIHFNLNIATLPTWNDRQALYQADIFEEYVQRLGLNSDDDIVVYARGPLGGMLHAARVWALFRVYGYEQIRVLDGGFRSWRKANLPTTVPYSTKTGSDEKPNILGNWTAFFNSALIVTYEELTTPQSDGYCILSRLIWYNFLDARPKNEFLELSNSQQYDGSRLSGLKFLPADELIDTVTGRMIDAAEIEQKLQAIGYNRGHQTMVAGDTADEASLVLLGLKTAGESTARLYNGGIEELRKRAPQIFMAK